jgi:hypothetical protein
MRAPVWLLGVWVAAWGALVAACASTTPASVTLESAAAEEALSTFLSMLASGEYEQAAGLYGGPLDALQAWNPEMDAQDVGGLLGYGCQSRLLQCLPVRSIALAEHGDGEMAFNVEFSLPDGTQFVRGPCCGATSTEMPYQSVFVFRLQPQADGGFVVLDLPPYVP